MSVSAFSAMPPSGSRKMTPQQQNRMRILNRVLTKAFVAMVANGRKRAIHKMGNWRSLNAGLANAIDTIFTGVASKRRRPDRLADIDTTHAHIIEECLEYLFTSAKCRGIVERSVLADLHANGAEYELMAQMPLPKRERKPKAEPATPVDEAASKVRAWEKKLRMAENKLKKYRRRLKRLQKKGAVT